MSAKNFKPAWGEMTGQRKSVNHCIKMNFGHKDYLKTVQPCNNGYQWTFEFPNGYGASVIRTPYSYGGDQGKFEVKQYLNEIKELPDDKRTSMGCI